MTAHQPLAHACAAARDIWAHKDVGTATGHVFSIQDLAPHDSRFLFFHP